jgi:hypothetical protein
MAFVSDVARQLGRNVGHGLGSRQGDFGSPRAAKQRSHRAPDAGYWRTAGIAGTTGCDRPRGHPIEQLYHVDRDQVLVRAHSNPDPRLQRAERADSSSTAKLETL